MGWRSIVLLGCLGMISYLVITIVFTLTASASSLSTTTLVSGGIDGKGGNNSSYQHLKTLSHDGRIAVYTSDASNIVPNDTNDDSDVFAYDRLTKKTELISASSAGIPANDMSAGPTISADGRFVAFVTYADNILPKLDGCKQSWCGYMIVHDRVTGKKVFANLDSDGKPLDIHNPYWNTISGDGRSVIFSTEVMLPGDMNDEPDTYIHNLQTGTTQLVAADNYGHTGPDGGYGYSSSADGRYVVFDSWSQMTPEDTNTSADVYLRDTLLSKTSLLSPRLNNEEQWQSAFDAYISDDGKWVAFLSSASNLVPGDTNRKRDVFLRDLQHNTIKRISDANNGEQSDEYADGPSLSSDGRFIVYSSYAENLVPNDTNHRQDIFLYDKSIGLTRRVNRASADGKPTTTGHSGNGVISGDGKAILFVSDDPGLTPTALDLDWPDNVYMVYNPVVQIPYYDPYAVTELLQSFQ